MTKTIQSGKKSLFRTLSNTFIVKEDCLSKHSLKLDSWINIPKLEGVPSYHYPCTQTPPIGPIQQSSAIDFLRRHEEPLTSNFVTNFTVSGWHGESLISKYAINIRNIINDLIPDAQHIFNNTANLTRSFKLSVYNEFQAFSKSMPINEKIPETLNDFWDQLANNNKKPAPHITKFFKTYSFRAVIIYLFKIRFIVKLCQSLDITPQEKDLLNPNSFLQKIFKKNSSTELMCESLHTNQYSWYRPSDNLHKKIHKLAYDFNQISITEMIKICSPDLQDVSVKDNYSHAISHKNFGLFINTLLIFMPYWLENKSYPRSGQNHLSPNILRCKYTGQWLSSVSLSHWLAQESNLTTKWHLWSELICPNFIGDNFEDGIFIKLCHELQFLTFLVQMASKQDIYAPKFLCEIMRDKFRLSHSDLPNGQISMFNHGDHHSDLLFERIFLNLNHLPKTNPHHFVVTRIQNEFQSLRNNGYLFVLTDQNLFVPSQSERIKQLLEQYQIISHFSFSNLKGKGEISDQLYVLTRRQSQNKHNASYAETSKNDKDKDKDKDKEGFIPIINKDICHTFRFSGDLESFHQFASIANYIEEFFLNAQSNEIPPLHQKELQHHLSLEYYQDAVIDGKLLQASSKDPNKITHPNFFKNLTRTCIYLNHFFQIENINTNIYQQSSSSLANHTILGVELDQSDKFPVVLIINMTNPAHIKLEIIPTSALKASIEELGIAFYRYYGLIPKIPDINLDLFRDFFTSNLGEQLIQLAINGHTKIKSKLKTLLIPSFFSIPKNMPEHLFEKLSLLQETAIYLTKEHPTTLINNFKQTLTTINELKTSYPFHLATHLLTFKQTLNNILDKYQDNLQSKIDYQNPLVMTPLRDLPTFNIYPDNQDINVDLHIDDKDDLQLLINSSKLHLEDKYPYLDLLSADRSLLRLYSEPDTLMFISFILNSSPNTAVVDILKYLRIPKNNELKKVVSNYLEMKSTLDIIYKQTCKLLNNLILEQVTNVQQ